MAELKNIARYEIKHQLGKGGMATVYLAHDPRFARDVAVKVLPREFLHDEKFLERFDREAKSIAKLEHSTIVPVYDYGEFDGQPFIVMRYMAGGSLKDRMAQGALSTPEVLNIISRIADALQEAHLQGIIHRDLKPDNVLFDARGNAYLADFGIAKLIEATAELTGSGLIGTPAYMSPEQVQSDQHIDGRSDVYSLGIILYEMLTGKKPFEAETPAKLVFKHLLDPIPNILEDRPDLPTDLKDITDKALAKDRDERFSTSIELSASLKLVLDGKLKTDAPESESLPISNPSTMDPLAPEVKEKKKTSIDWRWIAGGAVALILLAVAFMAGSGMENALFASKIPTSTIFPTNTTSPNPIAAATSIPTAADIPEPGISPTPIEIIWPNSHEMVRIPAGGFEMGSGIGSSDESPVHPVYLSAYYIDLYEVTNTQYAVFLNEQGNQREGGVEWLTSFSANVRIQQSGDGWVVANGYEDHPVTEVSWYGAAAYCQWMGGGLPTEAQWENAALGRSNSTYPWGEGIDYGFANYDSHMGDTMPVGSYPEGISPYGVYDMAGNVWEWVADWYASDYYAGVSSEIENPTGSESGTDRVLRGGGWDFSKEYSRSADRSELDPANTNYNIGFRCVSSP